MMISLALKEKPVRKGNRSLLKNQKMTWIWLDHQAMATGMRYTSYVLLNEKLTKNYESSCDTFLFVLSVNNLYVLAFAI